jgi:hypothetical protein
VKLEILSYKKIIKMLQKELYKKELSKNTQSRMVSSELLRRAALVRTDVSEEPGASFIRVKKSVNWE